MSRKRKPIVYVFEAGQPLLNLCEDLFVTLPEVCRTDCNFPSGDRVEPGRQEEKSRNGYPCWDLDPTPSRPPEEGPSFFPPFAPHLSSAGNNKKINRSRVTESLQTTIRIRYDTSLSSRITQCGRDLVNNNTNAIRHEFIVQNHSM